MQFTAAGSRVVSQSDRLLLRVKAISNQATDKVNEIIDQTMTRIIQSVRFTTGQSQSRSAKVFAVAGDQFLMLRCSLLSVENQPSLKVTDANFTRQFAAKTTIASNPRVFTKINCIRSFTSMALS